MFLETFTYLNVKLFLLNFNKSGNSWFLFITQTSQGVTLETNSTFQIQLIVTTCSRGFVRKKKKSLVFTPQIECEEIRNMGISTKGLI